MAFIKTTMTENIMNMFNKSKMMLITVAVLVLVLSTVCLSKEIELKALIVTGQNNHDWRNSSPILKTILENTGLFKVEIATSPDKGSDMSDFKPNFSAFDVLVLDYNGDRWSPETEKAFVEYVKGGGGVVVFHAADNSFPDWKEYNQIIGLGGWGGRDEKNGPYVYWKDGQIVRDTSRGPGGTHGKAHAFQVVNRNTEHPITKGLPEKWMHATDELYSLLRGPAENMTVLSTAYHDPGQDGTGRDEPILIVIEYGKGRVFHTVLGHCSGPSSPAMQCGGFIVTFQRGSEWAATGKVTQQVPEDLPTATQVMLWKSHVKPNFAEMLTKISGYEYGQSIEPLQDITGYIRVTSSRGGNMTKIEQKLIEFLSSNATLAAKQFACEDLSIVGGEKAVPTLTEMLVMAETTNMARYALERIPSEKAEKALLDSLLKTSGAIRIGIINSLGVKESVQSIDQIKPLMYDSDMDTALAAISALGRMGSEKAANALLEGTNKVKTELQLSAYQSCISSAEKMIAAGNTTAGYAVCRNIYDDAKSSRIRGAALQGMVAAKGNQAGDMIIAAIKSEDDQLRQMAFPLARNIDDEKMTVTLAMCFDSLEPENQVQLLTVLAERGDKSALSTVAKAAKSSDQAVRQAALQAVGKIGDESSVIMLAEASAKGRGDEQKAARNSLYVVSGKSIDAAFLSELAKAQGDVKIELIKAVKERMIRDAYAELVTAARSPDSKVRLEAFKALKEIGTDRDLSQIIELLVQESAQTNLNDAENTVVAIAKKADKEDAQVDTILKKLGQATEPRIKASLLTVLGKIENTKGLPALREGLNDQNPDLVIASVRALSKWPTDEPINDLLRLAKQSTDDTQRILATRGFVRMIEMNKSRSNEELAQMYQQAMSLAKDDGEKKNIFASLSAAKSIAAMQLAAEAINDPVLGNQAKIACVEIAEKIYGIYPQYVKNVLRDCMAAAQDQPLKDRIAKVISKIEKFEDFIVAWEVSRPYKKDEDGAKQLFDVPFPPEDPQAKDVKWQILPAGFNKDKPMYVEIGDFLPGNNQVAYLRSKVWSPVEQDALMILGSDDGIKVWLNGRVVHQNNTERALNEQDDKVQVTLTQGWNKLLVKVTQSASAWRICVRFSGLNGQNIEGLKAQIDN
jgi:uncharacterized protein